MAQRRTAFRPKACTRCGGDAYLETQDDEQQWICIQCGRSVVGAASPSLAIRRAVAA